jgi:GAF domain-containing protein
MNERPPVPTADAAAVLDAVALAALQSLPVAVSVSVTLVNEAGARTAASSSDWADALDRAQYATGHGPCVEASIGGEVRHMTNAADETRWPAYTAAALALGAMSSLSIPIPVDDEGVVAALNAFAAAPVAFTAADELILTRLAGTAAAALTTVSTGRGPLRSRDVVDQAKGILMTTQHCSAQQALDVLSSRVGETGISLRRVAEELVRATATS